MSTCLVYCVRGTITQPLISVGCCVHYWVTYAVNKRGFFYFGRARSKGFATLRNVPNLLFWDKIEHAKFVGLIGLNRLFHEVRTELLRDISRSLPVL